LNQEDFALKGKSPFIYVHTQLLLKCDGKRWTKMAKKKKKPKITYSHRYITSSTDEATRENFCLVPSEGNAKLMKKLQMVSPDKLIPTGIFASD
jgi:hypothetical protein